MRFSFDRLKPNCFICNDNPKPAMKEDLPEGWLLRLAGFLIQKLEPSLLEKAEKEKKSPLTDAEKESLYAGSQHYLHSKMNDHTDKKKPSETVDGYKLIYQWWINAVDSPVIEQKKIEIALDLDEHKDKCPEGFRIRINDIVAGFSFTPNIKGLLEIIRQEIVNDAITETIIENGNQIHGKNQFYNIAHQSGYGIRQGDLTDKFVGFVRDDQPATPKLIEEVLFRKFTQSYRVLYLLNKLIETAKGHLASHLDYKGSLAGMKNSCGMLAFSDQKPLSEDGRPLWSQLPKKDVCVLVGEQMYFGNFESRRISVVPSQSPGYLALKASFPKIDSACDASDEQISLISRVTSFTPNKVYKFGETNAFLSKLLNIFLEEVDEYDNFITDDDSNVIDINWPIIKQKLLKKLISDCYFHIWPQELSALECLLDMPLSDEKIPPDLRALFTYGLIRNPEDMMSLCSFMEDTMGDKTPIIYPELIHYFLMYSQPAPNLALVVAKILKRLGTKEPILVATIIRENQKELHKVYDNSLNAEGETALNAAIRDGKLDDIEALLFLYDNKINQKSRIGNYPIHWVCSKLSRLSPASRVQVLKSLLALGADTSFRKDHLVTAPNALDYAIEGKFKPLIDLLLIHACSLSAPDQARLLAKLPQRPYDSVLHYALKINDVDLLPKLLKAWPEKKPLPHWFAGAITPANFPMFDLLIQRGISIDVICGDNNNTALYWALDNGHDEIARRLLNQGASVNRMRNRAGDYALDIAKRRNSPLDLILLILAKLGKLEQQQWLDSLRGPKIYGSLPTFVCVEFPELLPKFIESPIQPELSAYLDTLKFDEILAELKKLKGFDRLSPRAVKGVLTLLSRLANAKVDFLLDSQEDRFDNECQHAVSEAIDLIVEYPQLYRFELFKPFLDSAQEKVSGVRFQLAIRSGNLDEVKRNYSEANRNFLSFDKETAMECAIKLGRALMIEYLLREKAPIICDQYNAINIAMNSRQLSLITILLQAALGLSKAEQLRLFQAQGGFYSFLAKLPEKICDEICNSAIPRDLLVAKDINGDKIYGQKPLEVAFKNKNMALLGLLLSKGALITPSQSERLFKTSANDRYLLTISDRELIEATICGDNLEVQAYCAKKASLSLQREWLKRQIDDKHTSLLSFIFVHCPRLVNENYEGYQTIVKSLAIMHVESMKLPEYSQDKRHLDDLVLKLANATADYLSSDRTRPEVYSAVCIAAINSAMPSIKRSPSIASIIWACLCDLARLVTFRETKNYRECVGFFSNSKCTVQVKLEEMQGILARQPDNILPV